MTRRISLTVPDKTFIKMLAICRVERRRPAELARLLLEEAIERGLSPRQRHLFDADHALVGRPILRLIRGGMPQS